MLVVADLDKNKKKEVFDNVWNVEPNLSKYISGNDTWKENLNKIVGLTNENERRGKGERYSCNLYKNI